MFTGISQNWLDILNIDAAREIRRQIVTDTCPPESQWFEFARVTALESIHTIIVGQDPYYTADDAHGLAFSCKTHVPPSLLNIYKALIESKFLDVLPKSGDLTGWARQGVLLLNRALTTTPRKPAQHFAYWDSFTRALLARILTLRGRRTFVVLWGKNAQELTTIAKGLVEPECVLTWCHPSPLVRAQPGFQFAKCPHFRIIADALNARRLDELASAPRGEPARADNRAIFTWALSYEMPLSHSKDDKVSDGGQVLETPSDSEIPVIRRMKSLHLDKSRSPAQSRHASLSPPVQKSSRLSDRQSHEPQSARAASPREASAQSSAAAIHPSEKYEDDSRTRAWHHSVADVHPTREPLEASAEPLKSGELTIAHRIFTDGSCYPNDSSPDARGGFAAAFTKGKFAGHILYGNLRQTPVPTNIRAEGFAITYALEQIIDHHDAGGDVQGDARGDAQGDARKIQIITDSKFWINMVTTYMPAWSDVKFRTQSNPDLTKRLWGTVCDVRERGFELELLHVVAHQKTPPADKWGRMCWKYNAYVDEFAGFARTKLKPGEKVFEKM